LPTQVARVEDGAPPARLLPPDRDCVRHFAFDAGLRLGLRQLDGRVRLCGDCEDHICARSTFFTNSLAHPAWARDTITFTSSHRTTTTASSGTTTWIIRALVPSTRCRRRGRGSSSRRCKEVEGGPGRRTDRVVMSYALRAFLCDAGFLCLFPLTRRPGGDPRATRRRA